MKSLHAASGNSADQILRTAARSYHQATTIGMVAATGHQIGRRKSDSSPKIKQINQKIFRCIRAYLDSVSRGNSKPRATLLCRQLPNLAPLANDDYPLLAPPKPGAKRSRSISRARSRRVLTELVDIPSALEVSAILNCCMSRSTKTSR